MYYAFVAFISKNNCMLYILCLFEYILSDLTN